MGEGWQNSECMNLILLLYFDRIMKRRNKRDKADEMLKLT